MAGITQTQKGQGATEYIVLLSVVLGIALICITLLVWPVGTTKDAKKQQTDIHFKIGEIGIQTEGYPQLVQGLVGYWKFEEGSGTTATDSRGGNTGTLTNGPTWVTGKSGNALDFNSTNYVNMGSASSLNFANSQSFTVNVWAKASGTQTDGKILHKGWGSDRTGYEMGFGGGSQFSFMVSDTASSGDQYFSSASTAVAGQWYMLTLVVDRSSNIATGYVNSANVGTLDVSSVIGTLGADGNLNIGRDTGGNAQRYFKGSIDEVMIYNRALSQDEITLLYENPGYPQ